MISLQYYYFIGTLFSPKTSLTNRDKDLVFRSTRNVQTFDFYRDYRLIGISKSQFLLLTVTFSTHFTTDIVKETKEDKLQL